MEAVTTGFESLSFGYQNREPVDRISVREPPPGGGGWVVDQKVRET